MAESGFRFTSGKQPNTCALAGSIPNTSSRKGLTGSVTTMNSLPMFARPLANRGFHSGRVEARCVEPAILLLPACGMAACLFSGFSPKRPSKKYYSMGSTIRRRAYLTDLNRRLCAKSRLVLLQPDVLFFVSKKTKNGEGWGVCILQ